MSSLGPDTLHNRHTPWLQETTQSSSGFRRGNEVQTKCSAKGRHNEARHFVVYVMKLYQLDATDTHRAKPEALTQLASLKRLGAIPCVR